MNTPAKAKAISYVRFSSGRQARGSSVERQELMFAEWLATNNDKYEPVSFIDRGVSAYSGSNAKGGKLGEILLLIAAGEIKAGDALVLESIDRFSRQALVDSLGRTLDIIRAGIVIFTLEDGGRYDNKSLSDDSAFKLIGALHQANVYSTRLGGRVSKANELKRERARSGGPTSSVISAPWLKDGKLNEPFAQLVKYAVDLYLQGLGHRAIVITLQKMITTDKILFARYGNSLNASTVKRWLQSPELIGNWDSAGGMIFSCFEALISHSTFQQVQHELAQRRKTPSKERTYHLAGLVRCAVCNSAFHIRAQIPRATKAAPALSQEYLAKPKILYCNCSKYLKSGTCANNRTWSYGVFSYIYEYGLTSALAHLYMGRSKNKDNGEILLLDEQIAKSENEYEFRREVYLELRDQRDLAAAETAKRRLEELKAQKNSIEMRLATKVRGIAFDGETFDISEFDSMSILQKRALLIDLGYEISISQNEASLSISPLGRETFSQIRRLQKYACYVVKMEVPEVPEDPTEVGFCKYLAINSEGSALAEAVTEDQLITRLQCLADSIGIGIHA